MPLFCKDQQNWPVWWSRSRLSTWAQSSHFSWDRGPGTVLSPLQPLLPCGLQLHVHSWEPGFTVAVLMETSWWKPWLYSLLCCLVFLFFLFFSMIEVILFTSHRVLTELSTWVASHRQAGLWLSALHSVLGVFVVLPTFVLWLLILLRICRILAELQIKRGRFTLTVPFRFRPELGF